MKDFFSKYKWEIGLVFFGLIWLSVVDFFLQMSSQNYIFADSDNYLVAAKNLMVYHRGHDYRPIVISFIYGLPYLFGANDSTVYLFSFYVNLFCWLATAILIFKITTSLVRPKLAFYFTLLFYGSLGTLTLLYHLLSENLYTFWILFAFFLILKYYQSHQFWYLSFAIALLVSSMLIRPGSKWLAVVFCLYFVRILWKNFAHKAMILFYSSWILIVIQCAGLYHQFGNFTISYIDSITYYNYIGSKAICLKEGREYTEINNPRANVLLNLKNRDTITKVAKADFVEQLKTNKINLLKAYFSDVFNNTSSGSAAIAVLENVRDTSFFKNSKEVTFFISKWQNRVFTIVGLILALVYFFKSYKREVFFTLISSYILYIIAVSGITFSQGDRFHMVFYPMVIILFVKWLKDRKLIS